MSGSAMVGKKWTLVGENAVGLLQSDKGKEVTMDKSKYGSK